MGGVTAMRRPFSVVAQVAASDATVLLFGETRHRQGADRAVDSPVEPGSRR